MYDHAFSFSDERVGDPIEHDPLNSLNQAQMLTTDKQ